ncbi:ATP-binding protein [Rhodococcus sp. Leaf7]|uniref:ABC1 kinase family protein n=1 Tax=unclassified Rhodococcus (in: high G+C Gram-positive bacteria) TaxID=192944 RepID=UPI0006FAAC03|nr:MULTISPECIES: AarF/ABC1/UbiB kinase family protein [unclassified Rhodococcus (in: high G+C Gram-positive bacteria)]KQU06602.1 ATP-binding protein [Rhodococcus sp. Leaf7]KQU42121.1 ATP-binding protein [Rhodococcus sp. Leaf247]
MPEKMPTSRVARGAEVGRLVAGRTARNATLRIRMAGRTEALRTALSEKEAVRSAERVVTVLGGLRGAAMKLGQMLSTLDLSFVPDEHREEFHRKLADLQSRAPSVSFADIRRVVEADLGAPMSTLFAHIDEEPFAAASIGQVHRAELHDGRIVAVKVKYPGIDEAVRADLKNLSFYLKLLPTSIPMLSSRAVVDELRRNLEAELDYVTEEATHRRAAALYREHPHFFVPDTVPERCGSAVLTTDFVDAVSFEDIRAMPADVRDRVGETVFRFYIGSLHTLGEFCGDPHPGNVLLAKDGRVTFIDFGLYLRMTPADVAFERDCLRAAVEGRGDDLLAAMSSRGILDPAARVTGQDCLDYVEAAAELSLTDEQVTVTPEMAGACFLLAVDPRSGNFGEMTKQWLPPEHVFSRRADFLTFGILGQLRATGNWGRIAREWLYDEAPATPMGVDIAEWSARWR